MNININGSKWDFFLGMLYGNSKTGNMQWNLPLWFLPCFFSTLLLAGIVELLIAGKFKRRIFVIIFFIIFGYIYGVLFSEILLPFQIETSFRMIVWFELGKLYSETDLISRVNRVIKVHIRFALSLLCLLIGSICALCNGTVAVRIDQYSNVVLYYVAALFLINGLVFLCVIIRQSVTIEYVGQKSLFILLFHKFPIVLFQMILKKYLQSENLLVVFFVGLFVAICALVVCLLFEKVFNTIKNLFCEKKEMRTL